MQTELMPTQLEDVEKIASTTDLPNYSEPGTGKTLTTIGAIERMALQTGLVVCPTIATSMWTKLLASELGAKTQWLKQRKTVLDKTADFYIAAYGVVGAHADALKEANMDALVVDESQYCKGPDSQRTQVIFGEECNGIGGLYQNSEQCFTLSGEPVERFADDLWSQLRATQPEALSEFNALSLEQFRRQFCRMELKSFANGRVTKIVSTANQNEKLLNQLVYHRIGAIRRTMAEVDPFMPPVTFRHVATSSKETPELKAILRGMTLEQAITKLMNGDDKMTVARRLLGIGKVENVVTYVTSIARHEQVLLGFWHREVGEKLYLALNAAQFPSQLIHGGTTPAARDRIRDSFVKGDTQVLVGQIQAMGIALDGLQHAGNYVIFAEADWSSAKMQQFYKRIARKGQRNHVQVDYCMADSIIDDALLAVSNRKGEGAKLIHDK